MASLISAPRCAYSSTSEPTSVRRNERVERSIKRTPSACSSSATRRLTVDVGILRRRAAFEKPLASTTWAKMISELRSDIAFQILENHSSRSPITKEKPYCRLKGSMSARAGITTLSSPRRNRERLLIQIQRVRSHGRLSDLNEVTVRIAHVAPHLGCMDFGLGDELRAP